MRLRGRSRSALLAPLALAAAVVAVIVLANGSDGPRHRLSFVADDATHLKAGYEVRQAGRKVGTVTGAEPTADGRARVDLRIEDDRAWPVRKGTRVNLRWAGTIRYSGRYVELVPGPRDARPLRPGEPVDARALNTVEFDEVLRTFDRATRQDLRGTLDSSGAALARAARPLRRALDSRAPEALVQARGLLDDLGADQTGLDQLVRSADGVADAAARARPGLGQLIDGSATTMQALAAESVALERTLTEAPGSLRVLRDTLGHADRTLVAADGLLGRLEPGVKELRRTASPLERTLVTLVDVGPSARRTLQVARTGAPAVTRLLDRLRTLSPRIDSATREAARQFVCVRPYAPEVAGFAATWAGFWGTGDHKDKYLRANVAAFPQIPVTLSALNSKQLAATLPGLRIAYPMPPGYVVGKPRFNAKCGIGPEVVTPEGDPETVPYDPLSKKLIEFQPEEDQGG